MTTKDVLLEGHHELCRNHAKSSSQGQCLESETIKLEGQWMWQRVKALTNVTIWSLFFKMPRDNLVRSPSASGETSKRWTSSLSRSIEIEKPWSSHKLGCPETAFQAPNSRVNDCVMERSTKCHKNKSSSYLDRIFNNLAITRLISQSQWRLTLQKYINILYLQHLRAKNLYCHLLIVADASIDTAKRATPDILPYGWYRYEIIRTDGGSQTEGSGECVSEVCIFIIRAGKFLGYRIKFKLLQPETAPNVCYLQTIGENKGIVVADRCILPCLD